MRSQWAAASAAFALVMFGAPAAAVSASHAHAQARGVQLAALFGESDEEREARLQHENDQDARISDLNQRIRDLEYALRQSTGQNEQLAHEIRQLTQRIEQQQKDFEYKLCTLAAQQLGASSAANETGTGLPCDPNAAMASLASPGSATPPAPSTGGSLGTLPADAAPQPAATRGQYDEAMNLLARARYDEARASFRAFADANPKDALAPQAVYWVGNIAFVQKDYSTAAQTFAEQIKKYPTSPQGADSMLKLGQALIALGQKKEGCLTLGAIKTKYKQAPASILSQAATARAGSCKDQRAD